MASDRSDSNTILVLGSSLHSAASAEVRGTPSIAQSVSILVEHGLSTGDMTLYAFCLRYRPQGDRGLLHRPRRYQWQVEV